VGYIGLAVHTAARVCSAAHGGQVLLSSAARDSVEEPASAGLRFRALGRYRLHGLADPEGLFQLLAKGLRASFPPPRTKGRSRKKS
jgi:class 3 adenylate cyclase